MPLYIEKKLHNKLRFVKSCKNYALKCFNFGIKSSNFGTITEEQFLFLKNTLQRKLKILVSSEIVKVRFLLNLNLNSTSLGLESRMGKGKGAILTKFSFVKPGQIIIVLSGIPQYKMLLVLKFLRSKIGLKLKLIYIRY